MRLRLSAASVLLAASAALAQDGQTREWGRRERLQKDATPARAEATVCPVCECKCERAAWDDVKEFEWDTDFKVVRASFNVYPYLLMTCPRCSYTTYSVQFPKALNEEQKKEIQEALKPIRREYADYWSVPVSFSVRAAVATQKALTSGEGTIFEIHLIGSYLAREANETVAEREMQRKAVENLTVATEKDDAYQRPRMRYLAGEIYRRLELYKEALDWFSKARNGADDDMLKLISRQELATRDAQDKRDRKPKK